MKNVAPFKHIQQLHVTLAGTPVGILALATDGKIWFEYLPGWIASGFNLSYFMNFDSKAQLAKGDVFDGLARLAVPDRK